MAPLVPRLLSVTYGSRTLGGSTDIDIDGPVRIVRDADSAQVSCYIIATAASSSAAATLWAALESDLTTPHLALTVTMDSETVLSLSPVVGTNTGFNSRASLEKAGTPTLDSRLSRRYHWSVHYDRPANLYSSSGRRTSNSTIQRDAGKIGGVTISAEYRALGGNDAYDQYVSAISAFATAIFARFDITQSRYELREESAVDDDRDKIVNITQRWAEIVWPDSPGTYNNSAIAETRLAITKSQETGGYSPGGPTVARVVTLSVSYSTRVPPAAAEGTPDIAGIYRSICRPAIIDAVRRLFQTAAIKVEQYTLDPTTRAITAAWQLIAYPGAVDQYTRRDTEMTDEGRVILPVWAPSNDRRDSAYVYDGPRIVQHSTEEMWSAEPNYVPSPADPPDGDTWIRLAGSVSDQTIVEASGIERTRWTISQNWRRVTIYQSPKVTEQSSTLTADEGKSF